FGCPSNSLCSFYDTQVGGRNDGAGAFTNNGIATVYEFAHPFNSGEPFDISLTVGQSIRCWPSIRILNETNLADTDVSPVTVTSVAAPNPTARMRVSPLAHLPGTTGAVVIASLETTAKVVLDGSDSSAVTAGPMVFSWLDNRRAIASSPRTVRILGLGKHSLT